MDTNKRESSKQFLTNLRAAGFIPAVLTLL